eukprot:1004266-Pyramimonas_sp.AAC.1
MALDNGRTAGRGACPISVVDARGGDEPAMRAAAGALARLCCAPLGGSWRQCRTCDIPSGSTLSADCFASGCPDALPKSPLWPCQLHPRAWQTPRPMHRTLEQDADSASKVSRKKTRHGTAEK